ncbi:MAG: hypothetical protein JWO09_2479 [Bacteroidetes bacterium]|nr:hypothetical protein [Bacteroidota bacterium]
MDRVESERIGIAGSLSRNYQAAKSLWDASSVQALIKFTDDKSPIVRCYAFLGLIKKKAGQQTIDDILNKHQNDTAKITTMNGCIVWNSSDVITYMKSISAPE